MLPKIEVFSSRKRQLRSVRIGTLRLWFSWLPSQQIFLAFGYEGRPWAVCADPRFTETTKGHAKNLEPDVTKWLPRDKFDAAWLAVSKLPISGASLSAIEAALGDASRSNQVIEQLESARQLLNTAHYRPSIVASVSAVESACRSIAGGDERFAVLIKSLDVDLPRPLQGALDKLWGYASDNARHGAKPGDHDAAHEDAELILGLCSTLVTYLQAKAQSVQKSGAKG